MPEVTSIAMPEAIVLAPTLFPEGVVVRALRLGEPTEATIAAFDDVALPDRLRTAIVERRVHFLAGRFCAREAMRALAPEYASLAIPIGENREPMWPFGIRGSISHTKRYAAAAVSHMSLVHGLGIDVERWMKPEAPAKLGAHITLPGELDPLVEASGLPPHEALTIVFSAKESLFKALYGGVGRYFGFHDARITAIDANAGTLAGQLENTLSHELPSGFRFAGRLTKVEGAVVTAIVWGRDDGRR